MKFKKVKAPLKIVKATTKFLTIKSTLKSSSGTWIVLDSVGPFLFKQGMQYKIRKHPVVNFSLGKNELVVFVSGQLNIFKVFINIYDNCNSFLKKIIYI